MAGEDAKAPGAQPTDAPEAAEPAQAVAESTHAVAEPAQAVAEPAQAVAEPAQAVAEPTQAVAEPAQAVAEPTQAVAEPTQAVAEPTQAAPLPIQTAPELAPLAPERPSARRPRISPKNLAVVGFFVGGMAIGALFIPLALSTGDDPPSTSAAASASASAPAGSVASGAPAASGALTDAAVAEPAAEDAAPPSAVWRLARLRDDPKIEIIEGTLGKRTLSSAVANAGLGRGEAQRIYAAFDGIKRLERSHAKDTFAFAREKKSGHVVAFEYATSPFDVWQARGEPDGDLTAKKLELSVEKVRVAVAVAVNDDLRASIVKAGLDDDMLKMLDDALEGHAELSNLRPGARLRIVATEEKVEGEFGRYAELDAVEYFPPNPNAPSIRVYWYGRDASAHRKALGGFYDAKGRQPYQGGWRTPVPLARISSRFNPLRMHPVLHVVMPHTGVDFAATTGTPIYATAAGVVTSAGDSGACGNMVMIRHSNGLVSGYCHMSRFAPGMHAGIHVEARQLVGYVGATGRVTGPHLHFIVKRGDTFIDPLSLRLDGVRVLPPSQRDEFAKRREELDAALDAIVLPASTGSPHAADAGASDDGGENEFFEEPP